MQFDYLDLLRHFEEKQVRYLVVGAYAVMTYTEPRFTNDLDLAIASDPTNAQSAFEALAAFGAPLDGVTPESLTNEREFYRMRTPFTSFDVMSGLWGHDFDLAWSRRTRADVQGVVVNIASIEDLLLMKRVAGRPQDLVDVERLERARVAQHSELASAVRDLDPEGSKRVELPDRSHGHEDIER